MTHLHDERPAANRPHPSHRRPPRARLWSSVSFRVVTAAGVSLAVIGGAVAVGTGAVRTPLSDSATKLTSSSRTLSRATATVKPSSDSFRYALATDPAGTVVRHYRKRKPKKTVAPHATPSATPVAAPTTAAPTATATPEVTPTAITSIPSSPAKPSSPASTSSSGLTPTATAEYQTPTGQNQLAWSEAILAAMGDPATAANIISIGYWMQNEAGKPPYGIVGANNPINVSEPGYGGTQIQYEAPGYYLMSYPTVADGVAATAAYLNRSSYTAILAALKAGTGLVGNSSVASELQVYSGNGYSQIPDSWGASQGTPES